MCRWQLFTSVWGNANIYLGVSLSAFKLNTSMLLLFSNLANRNFYIWIKHSPYDDAVFLGLSVISRWGWWGHAHLRLEWSLPLFCKPPWMSHPASSSLDKTMPSQGIALQRQKGLASIHRNVGMPSCYFIHIKGWILHDFFLGGGGCLLLPDLCSFASSFFLLRGFNCFPFFSLSLSPLKRQTCCLFFLTVRQAGKRDVGRDCSAKSAAAEREWKLLMNECHSFAAARCSWGHFIWMVSAWLLSATRETKMLRRCWFSEDLWAFLFIYLFFYRLSFSLFHWLPPKKKKKKPHLIHNSVLASFT